MNRRMMVGAMAAVVALVIGVAALLLLDRADDAGEAATVGDGIGGEATDTGRPAASGDAPAGAGDDGEDEDEEDGTTGSTTTIEITTDTVEADETTDEPADGDTDDGDTDGDVTETVPTLPPPTDGTCRITTSRLDGQAGVLDLGTDGACGALAVTIQAVNPRDDLTGGDWGRDIRVCQRHPAAAEVGVTITTGGGAIELTEGLSRTAEEAGADPIEAITITFDAQETPLTGPRPVALCRTDGAEMSIVHRPAR